MVKVLEAEYVAELKRLEAIIEYLVTRGHDNISEEKTSLDEALTEYNICIANLKLLRNKKA